MARKKLSLMLSEENCEDLWSALSVWRKEINAEKNPITTAEIEKLIKKVRAHIKKIRKSK